MTILSGWHEQYERMLRSHSRLVEIAGGTTMANSDEARDALFHFFQDAYHLKDWLKKDPSVRRSDVEHFINSKKSLRLMADLCNGTKHFDLTTSRTGDVSTTFDSQSVTVRPATVGSKSAPRPHLHGWTVASGGRSLDAIELANKVLSKWTEWLRKQQML